MAFTRDELIYRLKKEIANGKTLLGTSAGTGILAKSVENSGVDLIIVYNADKFSSQLEGLLPYGDANQIVVEMGNKVLPLVKGIPVLAGVCGTDPFRVMGTYLKQLKEEGFSGVQNFPTVGLFDGTFREYLEDTYMGYGLEIEMIREAHNLDMFTCPYVFNTRDAKRMAAAGADCLVAHMGLTTKRVTEGRTVLSLDNCVETIQKIIDVGKSVNPDILVMCHGGPLIDPEDFQYVLSRVVDLDGFFSPSSIERVSIEDGIKELVDAYKKRKI